MAIIIELLRHVSHQLVCSIQAFHDKDASNEERQQHSCSSALLGELLMLCNCSNSDNELACLQQQHGTRQHVTLYTPDSWELCVGTSATQAKHEARELHWHLV